MKDSYETPQNRALNAGTHSLASGTLHNHQKDLLEVSLKNKIYTIKCLVRVSKFLEGVIHCLHAVVMLDGCQVSDHHVSLTHRAAKDESFLMLQTEDS